MSLYHKVANIKSNQLYWLSLGLLLLFGCFSFYAGLLLDKQFNYAIEINDYLLSLRVVSVALYALGLTFLISIRIIMGLRLKEFTEFVSGNRVISGNKLAVCTYITFLLSISLVVRVGGIYLEYYPNTEVVKTAASELQKLKQLNCGLNDYRIVENNKFQPVIVNDTDKGFEVNYLTDDTSVSSHSLLDAIKTGDLESLEPNGAIYHCDNGQKITSRYRFKELMR